MSTSTNEISTPAPAAVQPDETEALLAALYKRDPNRSYATTLIDGRVCLVIQPTDGDKFVLPLPAAYRGSYCTSVEDVLKVDLADPALTRDDRPWEVYAGAVHWNQLSGLETAANAATNLIQVLCAYRCDAPHLMQATIHGVTLHWPRLDGGHVEAKLSTRGMAKYPATEYLTPKAPNNEVLLTTTVTLRGQAAKIRTRALEATHIQALIEELGLPKTPELPTKPEA